MTTWNPEFYGTNVLAWYDFSDQNTLTVVSSEIRGVQDKGSNGFDATGGVGTAGLITEINGASAAGFSNNRRLTHSGSLGLASPQPIMVGAISVPDDATSTDFLLTIGDISTGSDGARYMFDHSENQFGINYGGGFSFFDDSSPDGSSALVSVWETDGVSYAGPNVKVYRNGTPKTADNISNGESNPSIVDGGLAIGNAQPIGFAPAGTGGIGEIVIITEYNDDRRQVLEGYLAHKWGTESSLPVDHPFKTVAPVAPAILGVTVQSSGTDVVIGFDADISLKSGGSYENGFSILGLTISSASRTASDQVTLVLSSTVNLNDSVANLVYDPMSGDIVDNATGLVEVPETNIPIANNSTSEVNGALILPSDLDTTPAIWLDAADSQNVTVVDGFVSSLVDKSGTTDFSQSTANQRPAWGTTTLNGKNIIDFDGTNDVLSSAAKFTTQRTVFFVSKTTGQGTGASVVGFTFGEADQNSTYTFVYHNSSGDSPDISIDGTGSQASTNTGVARANGGTSASGTNIDLDYIGASTRDDWNIWFVQHDSNQDLQHLSAYGTASGGAIDPYQPAHLAEFIVYDTTLDDDDRQTIEGYLAHKWGLENNLPENHPYKVAPPRGTPVEPPPTGPTAGRSIESVSVSQDGANLIVTWDGPTQYVVDLV